MRGHLPILMNAYLLNVLHFAAGAGTVKALIALGRYLARRRARARQAAGPPVFTSYRQILDVALSDATTTHRHAVVNVSYRQRQGEYADEKRHINVDLGFIMWTFWLHAPVQRVEAVETCRQLRTGLPKALDPTGPTIDDLVSSLEGADWLNLDVAGPGPLEFSTAV